MSIKGGIYSRGQFWLDYDRGKNSVPLSPWLYICWYDPARGRIRRKSTRQRDVRLASDALDKHYLAAHQPSDAERAAYTVPEALTDYWLEWGCKAASQEAIRARLKLVTRFINFEVEAGRLSDPILPIQIHDAFIERFRDWATADPIISHRKNDEGEWVESSRRKRSASTVEESVIQLKAALNFAKKRGRIEHAPEFQHKTRKQVTPVRTDRLSVAAIGELLDFTVRGSGRYAGHADRLLPLRRYIIAAITTLGRPDAILDMSLSSSRGQWHPDMRVFDLNPAGRVQTRKYRAAVPVVELFAEWVDATDEWFVSGLKNIGSKEQPEWQQYRVGSVKSAWNTAREELGLPHGWGPKLLRHSMGTLLANRGVLPTELKLLMGHEALEGSQKAYIIFAPGYLARSREVIEEIAGELRAICPDALVPPAR